ncbi:MAG TPA: hypothetical protein VEG38_22070, partial [Acidimicrobiia bacterium]|nr:hypothetical protein [Acidimicrobiia bacterium]
MRRALTSGLLAVVFLAGLVGMQPAGAQVTAEELATSDVVVEPSASVSGADRERLAGAARDLRQRGVPTKFVVVANRPVNPTSRAQELRRAIGFNGNVLVLSQSPRSLGIASAMVPQAAIQDAFNAS